jgi:antitoxin VapB
LAARYYTGKEKIHLGVSNLPLNIKNAIVESLAQEVAEMTGETKTEAIRKSLEERRQRLLLGDPLTRKERVRRLLEEEIWPSLPLPLPPLSKEEEEAILGFGPDGV